MYQNSGNHHITQYLQNGASSTFESTLTFFSVPAFTDTGVHYCMATAMYNDADDMGQSPVITTGNTERNMKRNTF